MQNNREHIDDFLRDKMQDLQFEVNESHWADAERRLDEDKDKKRPFWFFFVAIVLLVGAGLTALTQYQGNPKTGETANNLAVNTAIAPSTDKNIEDANASEQFQSETAAQSQPTSNEANQNTSVDVNNQSKSTAANTTSSQSNTAPAPATNAQGFTTKSTTTANQPTDANKTQNKTSGPIASAAITVQSNKKQPANTQDAQNDVATISPKKVVTPVATPKTKAAKKLADAKDASANDVVKKATGIPETIRSDDESAKSNPTNMGDPIAVQANDVQNPIQNQIPESQKNIRVYKSPEDYQKLNPRYVASLANYNYTETVISLDQIKSDSIRSVAANQQTADTKPAQKKKKNRDPKIFVQEPSSLFVLAGLGGARGYIGNGTTNPSWGFSPSLGGGYQRTFSDRMSAYLSIYMSYISNLNIKETATQVTYSFDRDSTLLSVTRKNLLQLHLPIQLAYKLTPKFSILGGVGINFGINTISIYEDAKQSTQNKQFGYMGGLRFMDFNTNLGFEYAIAPRISLGMFYQQGFLDMTKNNYFNNQQTDINARGGILLRYKIIK